MLKKVLECLRPLIAVIVNKSLFDSDVAAYFKKAHVRPLIKKPNLDKEVMEKYQPMSVLPFLSKSLERVVATHLESQFTTHKLHDGLQSAYREGPS